MNNYPKMKERPEEQRPYEKFSAFGPEALTDAELLAIILKSGAKGMPALELADRILNLCPYEKGFTGIYHLSVKELKQLPGIGNIKAMEIKALGEISKRIRRMSAKKKLQIRNPESIADFYMERLRHEEREMVCCMMLDTKNNLIEDICMSKGTVNSSLISPREIFIEAVKYHAVGIVLVHNHPSGDPEPSIEDIDVTKRVKEAGDLLGIRLLDHVIIGNNIFYSIFEHYSF